MDFFKKLAGFGALDLLPMLVAKAMEKKTETQPTTTAATPPPMFDASSFSTTPVTTPFGAYNPTFDSDAPKYSPSEIALLASIKDPQVRRDLELKLSNTTDPQLRSQILAQA